MSPILDQRHLDALFLNARSNTRFADTPVDAAVVNRIWELAKWGPTSRNSIPLRLLVADSDTARRAVLDTASESNRPKLNRAPLVVVAARDEAFHEWFSTTGGSPAGRELLEADPAARRRAAHDGALLQLGYVIITLRALGLAVRPYGGFDAAALDAALLADSTWRSEVLLGVGYPAPGDHGAGDRRGRIAAADAVRVV